MKLASSLAALLLFAASADVARADVTTDAIMKRLDALEKENGKLRKQLNQIEAKKAPAHSTTAAAAKSPANEAATGSGDQGATVTSTMIPTAGSGYIAGPRPSTEAAIAEGWYFRKKAGSGLTFETPGGQITAYGQFDVSLDATTKGIKNLVASGGDSPIGNVGFQPAISTNLSYVGVRGSQNVSSHELKFLYQLETQIDISATSGTAESNSNYSNAVKGGLTSRNSFIGLQSATAGSIKVGKTDAPYKSSTASFNPFSGMLGDYSVIMGNSGGDNRVEFGTRLDHSIWWESANMNGLRLAALFSPGQNRAKNSDNIAAGESDCAGGNSPISGGGTSCNDGAFSDAISLSAVYKTGPLSVIGAYERHQKVNRSSDVGGPGPLGDLDIADEDAAKIGVQLALPTKTTISGIFESLHRYVPAVLAFQNERQRNGTWLAVTQELTPKDSLSFGWAHAFRTPGDPGQHNTAGGPDPQNQADMLTAAYKHTIMPGLMYYVDYAATINGRDAHFDLGAGGRGVTTDCHDAHGAPGGASADPHCWAGGHLQGISTGLKYTF